MLELSSAVTFTVESMESRMLLSAFVGPIQVYTPPRHVRQITPQIVTPTYRLPLTESLASIQQRSVIEVAQQTALQKQNGTYGVALSSDPPGVAGNDLSPDPNAKASGGTSRIRAGTVVNDPGAVTPLSVGPGFAALGLGDTGYYPPDTQGAIGPSNFIEIVNGGVAIYTRAGARLSLVTLNSFFTVVDSSSVTHPLTAAYDPRVVYDRRSGRFFATAMEFGNKVGGNYVQNGIILAVSRTSDATGAWDKYFLNIGDASAFSDYSTLGVDDNGVYIGVTIFPTSGGSYDKIIATAKASLLAVSPSIGSLNVWSNITSMYGSPQPATNFDAVAANGGRMWFVSGTGFTSNVNYRVLTWNSGTATLSTTYTATSPSFANPVNAPALSSTTNVDCGDMRILNAFSRNGHVYTTRNIGTNASGTTSSPDRTGAEWMDFNTVPSGNSGVGSLSQAQDGRIYDTAASNPMSYYYPSMMVNGQGSIALSFSGSSSTTYIGAYTASRLATDAAGTVGPVAQLQAGLNTYTRDDTSGRNRWGDYGYTSVDPNNDMTFWTATEYAGSTSAYWGTHIDTVLAAAPALNNPNGSSGQGVTGVTLNLTGTGFYDPGVGFTNRLGVVLNGGAINGISNYNVTYNSPTSVAVTFDVAANASAGTRDIVLTNPDGQSVTVIGGFTVTAVPGSITGTVYIDANSNTSQDAGENGIATTTTLFLDTNNNGVLDAGEVTTTTNGSGNYQFLNLQPGTYHVVQVVPTGFIATTALSRSVTVNSGTVTSGQVFGDFPIVFTGSPSGADTYRIDLDTLTKTRVEIYISGTLTYTAPAALPSLTFNLLGGDDTLAVDYVNGNPVPSGGVVFDGGTPGGSNADTLQFIGSNNADAFTATNGSTLPGAGIVSVVNIEKLNATGSGGSDSLTLLQPIAATVTYDGGSGTNSLTYDGTAGADSLTLNSSTVSNGTYSTTFSNTASLAINTQAGNDTTTVSGAPPAGLATTVTGGAGNDTLTINAALPNAGTGFVFNGGTTAGKQQTLNINAGTYTFSSDPLIGNANLTVNDNSALVFAAPGAGTLINTRTVTAINIAATATATIPAIPADHADRIALIVTGTGGLPGLSIASGGVLNLADNDLIVKNGNLTSARGWLTSGAANLAWNGIGIKSTSAASDSSGRTALGLLLNTNNGSDTILSSFDNQTVVSTDVIVKYTYYGDANLDGAVNGADYTRIDAGYGSGGTRTGWQNGDFNYDTLIDGSDYSLLDGSFGAALSPL